MPDYYIAKPLLALPRITAHYGNVILTVGGIKGGSGKSTVATHLADIYAARGPSYDFTQSRMARLGAAGYTCTKQHGGRVHNALREFHEVYPVVVVDTGGRDSKAQRSALAVSDLLVLPVVPRPYDTWTVDPVAEMLDQSRIHNPRLRALSFINRADRSGPLLRATEEFLRDAEKHGIEYSPMRLHTRIAFGAAAAVGLAVHEMQPRDDKAATEILALAGGILTTAVGTPFHLKTGDDDAPAPDSDERT